MKQYRIKDVESVEDFADGLQYKVFPCIKEDDKYITLTTCDGELLFEHDEVEEV